MKDDSAQDLNNNLTRISRSRKWLTVGLSLCLPALVCNALMGFDFITVTEGLVLVLGLLNIIGGIIIIYALALMWKTRRLN